jgi:hypothetical protein
MQGSFEPACSSKVGRSRDAKISAVAWVWTLT